jgi:hypothetical protein
VNDDSGTNSQFLPRIAVDQTTGNIAVSWYDARNDAGSGSSGSTNSIANDDAQLYATVSTDGGVSFQPNVRVSTGTSNAGTASNGIDYGDYTGLDFYNGHFYPVWADNSNSTGDNPNGSLSRFDIYTANVSVTSTPPTNNDNFANSIHLSGTTVSTTGSNVGFTGETGEPNHAGVSNPLNSAWWSWTAPSSGQVTLNTFGSNFDTTLGVYTGSAVNNLTALASNDDSGGTVQSQVTFNATAGTTYQIAVDGYSSSTGNIDLNLSEVNNDNFANSIALTGTSASTTGVNTNATLETGEPSIGGITGGHSVWWSWTAPVSGTVALNTFGSNFDTLLGVYTGSAVNGLTQVAVNDDANGTLQSQVSFNATAGTTYRIDVDGYYGASGNIALGLNEVAGNHNLTLARRHARREALA